MKFDYQVTEWIEKDEIGVCEELFKKYGTEYRVKQKGSCYAIFRDYVATKSKDLIRGVRTGVRPCEK